LTSPAGMAGGGSGCVRVRSAARRESERVEAKKPAGRGGHGANKSSIRAIGPVFLQLAAKAAGRATPESGAPGPEPEQDREGAFLGGPGPRVSERVVSYLAARFSSDEETCSSAEAARSSCAEYSMAAPKVCRGPNRERHARTLFCSLFFLTPNTPLAQNKCRH
jgi:hypothetical protein